MNGQEEMTVSPEPFWLQEAMACMNYVHVLDSEEWLNESGSWSRRRKEEFLAPYRSYRGTMRTRLQPIMEQYPLLMGYVDTAPRKKEQLQSSDPPMMAFLTQMQYILEAPEHPSEEKLEEQLNRAFGYMLSTDWQAGETMIRCVADVLEALEHWEGQDADKFKLLRLYSERREVMEQLWSLQAPCAEIGRSCLELVQERYDACMEKLHDPEAVRALLESAGLQCREILVGRITPSVMRYDRIMLRMREAAADAGHTDVGIHIGIETFFLLGEKGSEDLYRDDCLLSRLKALGDPTRLNILHLLTERPCYLQEMARELKLTPATVLHHLGVLMTGELIEVKITQEKKRVYYQVRRQGLLDVEFGIHQLTLTRQEREEQQRQQTQGGWQWNI